LIIEPDLLLLDEPLSALDVCRQAQMRKELREMIHACNVPSIIVTHDLRDVACIGDRACLLEKGKIVLTRGADEVMGWGASGFSCKRGWGRAPECRRKDLIGLNPSDSLKLDAARLKLMPVEIAYSG